VEARHNLAITLVSAKQFEKAVRELKAVIAVRPEWPDPYLTLGRAYHHLERNAEAIAAYRSALQGNPKLAAAAFRLGQLITEQGDTDEVIRLFQSAVQVEPDNASYRYALGRALKRSGRTADAQAEFATTQQLRQRELIRQNAETANSAGIAAARKGDFDTAVSQFNLAIEQRPDLSPTWPFVRCI
jgi:tetratricopeptide (TPR) repeat protein